MSGRVPGLIMPKIARLRRFLLQLAGIGSSARRVTDTGSSRTAAPISRMVLAASMRSAAMALRCGAGTKWAPVRAAMRILANGVGGPNNTTVTGCAVMSFSPRQTVTTALADDDGTGISIGQLGFMH